VLFADVLDVDFNVVAESGQKLHEPFD
jgi:hypothetical protein